MSADNGVPAENIPEENQSRCGGCGMLYGECGSNLVKGRLVKSDICKKIESQNDRIAELEADNGELRAQVQDLKASDEGHVRARQMDEVQIKELHAENKRIKEFLRQARQILMSCIIEQQREVWIDARKAWLNIYDNNFSGVG